MALKIIVTGHLDEVGFMVTQIDKKWIFEIPTCWPAGGNPVMLAQRVTIVTPQRRCNRRYRLKASSPYFITRSTQENQWKLKICLLILGRPARRKQKEWGVRPGDMIVPYFEFTVMNNEKMLLAKAWDNRIGCAIAINVLKELKNTKPSKRRVRNWCRSGEVGSSVSKTSTLKIQPDIGFPLWMLGLQEIHQEFREKKRMSKMGKRSQQIVLYDALYGFTQRVARLSNRHRGRIKHSLSI